MNVYKVKLVTNSGKSFSFVWKPTHSQAMAKDPCEVLLGKPYVCVSKARNGDTYVPKEAIDCITIQEIKGD